MFKADPSRPDRGPAYGSVLLAFVSLGVAVGSWGSRIPDVKANLELSEGALGTALLGLSLGAVAGSWIGGALVHRFGSRVVISRSWLAAGVLMVGPGLAGSWLVLATTALAAGLAIGILDVSMNGAGVQLEKAATSPLLNSLHAGWSGGILLGSGVGAAAVALGLSPGPHLAVVAVGIAAASRTVAADLPDGTIAAAGLADDPDPDHDPATASGSPRTGQLVALAVIAGCVFLGDGALLDWAGVFIREDLDGGPIIGALAVTGLSAGGLVGRLAGDRLAVRWGPAPYLRRGVLVASVAMAGVLVTPVAATVPVLLFGVGLGLAPAIPLAFATAGHLWGERGIAVVTTAGYGSYLTGPAVIGGLAHATTLRTALVVSLVLIVAVLPLAWSTEIEQP